MDEAQRVIDQTKKWITEVVVGCNFCPFAAKEIKGGTIHYQVDRSLAMPASLQSLLQELIRLDNEKYIETSLLIFPDTFSIFNDYLDLVALAEKLLKQEKYEGVYQIASFHPLYCFANAPADDAANYTNRSIYPMLHILREVSIDKALLHYTKPENIPERNMHFAREKGEIYMRMLRDSCI
jgi:uncharacterized protein